MTITKDFYFEKVRTIKVAFTELTCELAQVYQAK